MLKCRDAQAWMLQVEAGEAGAHVQARLDAHVARCARCREILAAQREVRDTLALRPPAPAPAGLAARVLARAGEQENGWLALANWRRWTQVLLPVTAAIVLVAALSNGTRPSGDTAPTAPGAEAWTAVDEDVVAGMTELNVDSGGEDLVATMLNADAVAEGGDDAR